MADKPKTNVDKFFEIYDADPTLQARVQQAMDSYDPEVHGYEWDEENPRIQLEPRGERGYIELRAVREKSL